MDIVKLSTRKSGSGGVSASLGVPQHIARDLDEASIDSFSVELTEEGILFRPITSETKDAGKPTWLKPEAVTSRSNGKTPVPA